MQAYREDLPEMEKKRRDDREYIKESGYWDIEEDIAKREGFLDLWKNYKSLPWSKQENMRREDPVIKMILKEKRKEQLESRILDSGLDRRILYWGYSTVPALSRISELYPVFPYRYSPLRQ